jgi:two-component system response regulator FlrC
MPVPSLSSGALTKLLNYPWPGNVRELDNVIQRALILSEQGDIQGDHILLEGVDWNDASGLQNIVETGQIKPTVRPIAETSPDVPVVEPTYSATSKPASLGEGLGNELRDQEFAIILETLVECNGRRKEIAEKLGISPRTLRYKLAKMRDAGIELPG